MEYTAIIFDFNGVILWDRSWHEQAWDELSKTLRNKPLSRQEHEHYIHGRIPKETLQFILRREPSKKELKGLLQRKEVAYQKIALSSPKFELSPGAISLFNMLKKSKIKSTIATSSPLVNVKFYYKYFNLNKWFPIKRIVYDDGQIPGKPKPDIYLKAAQNLGVDIKKSIVVEDAKSGIVSAQKAKAGKIIALDNGDNTKILKVLKVSKIITNLGQITIKDFSTQ